MFWILAVSTWHLPSVAKLNWTEIFLCIVFQKLFTAFKNTKTFLNNSRYRYPFRRNTVSTQKTVSKNFFIYAKKYWNIFLNKLEIILSTWKHFPYTFTLFCFQWPRRKYSFGDAKTKGLSSVPHFEKYRYAMKLTQKCKTQHAPTLYSLL